MVNLTQLPAPVAVKIVCGCGQKYSFDVFPVNNQMPAAVKCPVCGRDGTAAANEIIARASLAPYLAQAVKDAVVQELAAQRRELLEAQKLATTEIFQLVERLDKLQSPMHERLQAYESQIQKLEKELALLTEENHELLKMKIEMIRHQLESERARSRVDFTN